MDLFSVDYLGFDWTVFLALFLLDSDRLLNDHCE